jgi:hypothetical protein
LDGVQRGLAGEDIHVFARIACVANHFDRLRRPFEGPPQPRVRVLRTMLGTAIASRFDPVILATLPSVVPAYPPGSIIKLSNGLRAVVIRWHTEAPCQPTVQLLDESGNHPDTTLAETTVNHEFDLRQQPDLRIVEHDDVDVSGDNFRLIQPGVAHQKTAA